MYDSLVCSLYTELVVSDCFITFHKLRNNIGLLRYTHLCLKSCLSCLYYVSIWLVYFSFLWNSRSPNYSTSSFISTESSSSLVGVNRWVQPIWLCPPPPLLMYTTQCFFFKTKINRACKLNFTCLHSSTWMSGL